MRIDAGHILAVFAFAAGGTTLALSNTGPPPNANLPRPPEIRSRTLQSTPELIEISYQIPAPRVRPSPPTSARTQIEIQGATTYSENGQVEVPVFTQYIAIPHCDDVEISVAAQGIEIIRNVIVPPGGQDGHVRIATIPPTWARLVDIQYLRGQALARVELYPVRFNGPRQ